MIEQLLTNTTVRVIIKNGNNILNIGTGTLIKRKSDILLFTAYHCIYGENDEFINQPLSQIFIENQATYNSIFSRINLVEILDKNKREDWVIGKLENNDLHMKLPFFSSAINFSTDMVVKFKGFQAQNSTQSRTFNSRVLDPVSNSEFRISLAKQDEFKDGTDSAKGLSGSGAYLIIEDQAYLIGILKSVYGDDALNHDIKCCPCCSIKKHLDDDLVDLQELKKNSTPKDSWGSRKFGEIRISDPRSLEEKILAVTTQVSERKIQKYCRDMANGIAELSESVEERDLKAIQFRIFDACQDELIDFLDKNKNRNQMNDEDIKQLIQTYRDKAITIVNLKSKNFSYPSIDDETMRRIILNLINECYLSFDEKGIYEN